MNCTKSEMVRLLRRLGRQASMPDLWDVGLHKSCQDWDLYDFAKDVALALVACNQLDPTLSAYVRLCREHGANGVTFLKEEV
jgi:hypothetical protein